MKATFEQTMDILVKAYLNDTLVHGNCYACAVGNLVAANNGYKYVECKDVTSKKLALDINKGFYMEIEEGGGAGGHWFDAKVFGIGSGIKGNMQNKEISSTGYSLKEIAKIECAFETADKGENDDDWMFNGLMAVLEVVAEIHGKDLSDKKVYEDKFQEIFASK